MVILVKKMILKVDGERMREKNGDGGRCRFEADCEKRVGEER